MSANTDVIDAFIAAFNKSDIDEIMSFFTPDAVYTNIPMDPPNEGPEMIRKTIEGFIGMSQSIEFEVHHTTENPETGVVMNERTDKFLIGEKTVAARVMGVFELEDGKIKAWRDYFDLAEFQTQFAS
jgi:limonene-1,2-epoxide hydrolase